MVGGEGVGVGEHLVVVGEGVGDVVGLLVVVGEGVGNRLLVNFVLDTSLLLFLDHTSECITK